MPQESLLADNQVELWAVSFLCMLSTHVPTCADPKECDTPSVLGLNGPAADGEKVADRMIAEIIVYKGHLLWVHCL